MSALTRKVRVAGSAAAATSRTVAGSVSPALPQARTCSAPGLPSSARMRGQAVFGHGEDHVARPVVRQAHHRGAGGHHGAGLGIDRGDDARRVGATSAA